ncbi:hypothetical protein PYW08_008787 [Mythimna loreyi]|uniref:Uncharacterized protein n=1 Tax=Mythimna loreyi TaxID=667449 RepID=A0ACC2QDE5_9NEOP|nr:hypothetical protein PYW08_008787 [Mythimna loreyi]
MSRLSVALRQSMCALLPNRRVKKTLLLTITFALLAHSLTINKLGHPEIVAKTRVQLLPININTFLNDIIRISAPVLDANAIYYIHKPNGDVMKLNITSPKLKHLKIQPIVTKFVKHVKPIIQQENNYNAFMTSKEEFDRNLKKMEENDFMIGPLVLEDHGNWVLSAYTKDINDDWVEVFQVISVNIVEYVPLHLSKVSPNSIVKIDRDQPLNVGETVHIGIPFPIPHLQTCELVAPSSTFDRFYDRFRKEMSNCGYTLPNITIGDAGLWKIFAVGKIVYEGEINLNIVDNKSTKVVIH